VLEVKASTPVCRACRRETILWSIMLYIMVAGAVLMIVTMKWRKDPNIAAQVIGASAPQP
jgi:multidrug efflux pump subunit AcrB